MKQKIKLNQSHSIDLPKLIESRLLVQANSGGGKSWLLRRILEQSHGKVQQIVIDVEGEFSTLREKYDYILASKEGDTPAETKSAALLATRLLELNVSAIIDLYELRSYERKAFVKAFLDAMVNAPKKLRHDCLVVIDEAHIFCPEKGQSEAGQSVIDLATLGRKRGFCAILATQRLSKLHKDAAAECNNKLIGRTGLDIDRKRASEELGFNTKEQSLSLRSLESGEFYAFGPALSMEIKKIKVGKVLTTHPKVGSRIITQPTPPTKKIMAVLKKIKDLPEESEKEARTVAEFKQKITGFKREMGILKRQQKTAAPSQDHIDRAVAQATNDREREFTTERKGLENHINKLSSVLKTLVIKASQALEQPIPALPAGRPKIETKVVPVYKPPRTIVAQPQKPTIPINEGFNGEVKPLTGGALRMVEVLVSKYPMKFTKKQLATFSNMKSTGGSYGTYLSRIRTRGLIEEENDLIVASEKALAEFEASSDIPQTPEELIQMWRSKFSGGARRIFDVLIENYPNFMDKDSLASAADMEAGGGSFGTYLSRLRSNSLIEVDNGRVKAADNLFI